MKIKTIDEKISINKLLDILPEAGQLLIEKYGIFCVGCPMAQAETLGQGAKSHGLGKKEREKMLVELNKIFLLHKKSKS